MPKRLHPVFRRWLHILVAALLSGGLIFYSIYSKSTWAITLSVFTPAFLFGVALVTLRHPFENTSVLVGKILMAGLKTLLWLFLGILAAFMGGGGGFSSEGKNNDRRAYVFMVTAIGTLFGVLGLMFIGPNMSFVAALIGLPAFGAIGAVLIGAGYGHILKLEHPSIGILAAFGAAGFLLPYLAGRVILYTSGIALDMYIALFIVMCWQMLVGYAFCKETSEDVASDKDLKSLINKMGTKPNS